MKEFKSVNQVASHFNTDEQCCKQIIKELHGGQLMCYVCDTPVKITEGVTTIKKSMRCFNCNYQVSVLKNTMFYQTRVPLREWMKIIYLFDKNEGKITAKEAAPYINLGMPALRRALEKLTDINKGRLQS